MEREEYCRMMETDISGWKSEISDILEEAGRFPGFGKNKIAERLKLILGEMNEKIEGIRNECMSGRDSNIYAVHKPSEAHDCIMKMNIWDMEHIAPEDM